MKKWWLTTKLQDRVLLYWLSYWKQNIYFPTLKIASEDLELGSTSAVQRHLLALEKKGFVIHELHRYWGINIKKIEKHLIETYGKNYSERLQI